MKKVLFCLGLFFFMAGAFTANAQSIIDAEEDHNFNDFYKKDQVSGRVAMPYPFLRESDVVWEHAVWRTIDFREKFNQFFYFPIDASKNTQGRVSLTTAIMDALKNGDIEVFKEDDLTTPFTYEEMMSQLTRSYTFHIAEYDEWGDETEGRDTLITEEFRPEEGETYELGQAITVADFAEGSKLDITGTSKGKGTQGNIKRHHHRRGPMSHGSKHKRLPGGLAAATYPSRVFLGNEGPGRTGRDTVTVQNLVLVKTIADRNLMLVKGAVPGNKGGLLKIRTAVKGQ